MQVHQDRCPNCSKSLCFPVEYPGEQFRLICPHCSVGYDLKGVEVSEEYLDGLIHSRRAASFVQKPEISKRIFRYLASITPEIRFGQAANSNAIVFLVSQTRSSFPLAVYFLDACHLVQPLNRLLFTVSLTSAGALLLLAGGLSLVPVLIGATIAAGCFYRFTTLPKVKGVTRKRLEEEQRLLIQCYDFQQILDQVCEARFSYQNLLDRQKYVLSDMMQTPEHYPTQVDLYQRSIRLTEGYLSLCDRVIQQYKSAIRSAVIQIETSKLSVELPADFVDSRIEFGLDLLEDQLASHVTSEILNRDPNNHSNP